MKNLIILFFVFFSSTIWAQNQQLCLNDVSQHRYWVTPTQGSTYAWTIEQGSGEIISGQGTHEIMLKWTAGTSSALIKVVETNAGNCQGDEVVLSINFADPTATLTGNSANFCTVPAATGLSVVLTGNSPWTLNYTVNGTPQSVSQIANSPYTLSLDNMEHGNAYTFELSSVTDNTCPGTVSGEAKTITIYHKVNTSAIQFE
jgi:hypothetical protein